MNEIERRAFAAGFRAALSLVEKHADEHQGQEVNDHLAHRTLRRLLEILNSARESSVEPSPAGYAHAPDVHPAT